MTFSYKIYWNACFVLPAVLIGLTLILFILASYGHWVKAARKTRRIYRIMEYVFCICITAFCISSQFRYLTNGGVYLLAEKEQDACIYTGIVESICEPSKRFPGFKISHRYGADIVIDGEQFFAVTCGDIEEGDTVIIQYLPKSRFVLSIHEAQENKHQQSMLFMKKADFGDIGSSVQKDVWQSRIKVEK